MLSFSSVRGTILSFIIVAMVVTQSFRQGFVGTYSRTPTTQLKTFTKEYSVKRGKVQFNMNSDETSSTSAQGFEDTLDHEFPLHKELEEESSVSKNSSLTMEAEVVDPKVTAIRALEKKLASELQSAKALLAKEQSALFDIQENMFSSGKNGYFLVQSQINDFHRKIDSEQKMKVESHKKKLASKILPLLNLFQSIPKNYLATTDRERKMHEDFKVLVRSIIIALQKYGYAEFSPVVDDIVDEKKHEVVEWLDSSPEDDKNQSGFVVSVVQSGIVDASGIVVRKAEVIASKRKKGEDSE